MNIYLGHLSNYMRGPKVSTAVRSILDHAQRANKQSPPASPDRTLAVRLPAKTVEWIRHQADTKNCTMAEIIRAFIADQAVSELTALYQQHILSSAEFSASLWAILGYEPESSPEEEVRSDT